MPKDVEIESPRGKLVVTLRRLTAGEMHRLQDEATDVKIMNGQPYAKVVMSTLRENGVLKSIMSVKDEKGVALTLNGSDLQALDPVDFDKLYEVFDELNSQGVKKNS